MPKMSRIIRYDPETKGHKMLMVRSKDPADTHKVLKSLSHGSYTDRKIEGPFRGTKKISEKNGPIGPSGIRLKKMILVGSPGYKGGADWAMAQLSPHKAEYYYVPVKVNRSGRVTILSGNDPAP